MTRTRAADDFGTIGDRLREISASEDAARVGCVCSRDSGSGAVQHTALCPLRVDPEAGLWGAAAIWSAAAQAAGVPCQCAEAIDADGNISRLPSPTCPVHPLPPPPERPA